MSTTTAESKTSKKRNQWPRVRFFEGRAKPWRVDGRIKGKGSRYFYATASEADTKAEQLRTEKKNDGSKGAAVPAQLREDAIEAERQLAGVGATLMEAVRYFLAHAKPTGGTRTVAQVVSEFLTAKRNAGRRETYLDIQKIVLEKVFGKQFGTRPVNSLTAPEIEAWMNGKEWSMRTRLNYFCDIRNLLGFAVRKGYRPTNPMSQLEKPTVNDTSPGVLTIDQVSALLNVCAQGEAEMLAPVAIGLFAGLRTEELDRLDWRHISLAEKNIQILPEVAKTREGRDVEIHPALLAWLLPLAKTAGKVAPEKSYDWRLHSKMIAAGIAKPPKNSLRHSFASHHFAAFRNAPLTSAMLGHSGGTYTFEKRYKKRVTPSDGAAYWKILPTASGKIVSFKTKAA